MACDILINSMLIYGTYKMTTGINYGISNCKIIDTATSYENEKLICDAISMHNIKPLIITKFCPKDFEDGISKKVRDHITKLGDIPRVILLHTSFGDNKRNLEAFVELRKIFTGYLMGVSNFSRKEIKYLIKNGCRIDAVQLEYHPKFQPDRLVKYCQDSDIIVMGYRPFAKGDLLEDPKIMEMAKKLNSTPPQLILKWIYNKGIIPVVSSNSEEHIRNNLSFDDTVMRYNDLLEINSMNMGKNGSTCMAKYCEIY